MALRPLTEVGEELARWATSDIPRVPTGFWFFDSRTRGGIAPGEVAALLARTSVGKTWFAVNVVNNTPHIPTIFASLEMHARYVLSRLTAVHLRVPTWIQEEELAHAGRCQAIDETIEAFPLLEIEDEPGRSLADMTLACEEYKERHGRKPMLVIIDFLELIKSFGMSQTEKVDDLGWALKDFARATDTAVLVLHQVKRGEAHKERWEQGRRTQNQGHLPLTLTDARFGGEMSADYVLGMYRPALDPKMSPRDREARANDLRLQLLKNRGGHELAIDGVQHHWDVATGRISELRW